MFLRSLDAQIKLKDKGKKEAALLALQKELKPILNNPLEERILEYFDINAWIESKLTNRKLEEVLKEKK